MLQTLGLCCKHYNITNIGVAFTDVTITGSILQRLQYYKYWCRCNKCHSVTDIGVTWTDVSNSNALQGLVIGHQVNVTDIDCLWNK